MITRRIAGCVLAAVLTAGLAAQAQWERIPIQGGHFERLVKHPFKENELYGIVEKNGIYRSTDQGYTWANWLLRTKEHPWINISALTFTIDGSALMIANGYPYLSRDDGITWVDLSGPLGRLGFFVYAHVDLNGRITLFNDRSKSFLSSTDSCRSWTEFPAPAEFKNYPLSQVSMDWNHPDVIMLGETDLFMISFDYGVTWRKTSAFYPVRTGRCAVPRVITWQPQVRLGMWLDGLSQYFESTDSATSWNRVSVNHPTTTGRFSPHCDFITGDRSTMYLLFLGDVHISGDSGKSWRKLAEQCWSLAVYDDHMVGSFAMDGIKISTDRGETWVKDPVTMLDGIIPEVHFSVTRDTITALVVDVPGVGPVLRQLRQSSDRGLTWKTLFTTTSVLDQLTVTSNPSLRYYVMCNKKALLRGGFGQEVPDTVLTLERTPIQWPTNIPQLRFEVSSFNDLFLSAADIGLYWSTDGGDSWGRSGIPYGYFGSFNAVPSKDYRDRLVAYASAWDPMIPVPGGLFATSNRGASWSVLRRDEPHSISIYLPGEIFFRDANHSFSTDYGQTWVVNRKGIDSGFTTLSFTSFDMRTILVTGCDSAWYSYTGDGWEEILGVHGERLSGMPTTDASVDGDRLYVFRPYEGLFVTRSPTLTGLGGYSAAGPESAHIQAFPNPVSTRARIRFPGENGAPPGSISVTDVMGRHIRSIDFRPATSELSWDLTDDEGRRVRPGVYYLTVSKLGAVTSKGTIIVY